MKEEATVIMRKILVLSVSVKRKRKCGMEQHLLLLEITDLFRLRIHRPKIMIGVILVEIYTKVVQSSMMAYNGRPFAQ